MRFTLRSWKLVLPLATLVAVAIAASVSLASSGGSGEIRIAIMTDCKGAFGFGYEPDIGGAQAALAQYAGAKPKNPKKPSAGITGGKIGGKSIRIVGYGCGNDTADLAIKETKRLMEQKKADVMIGPLSGDEGVAVANYAKTHPSKTFIIGTAGSQDPTLQIAPKNVFRYHGDGAQWNAGIGEIAYKKLGWRKAAIIMDDYSFGWTSAAGMIADFCSVGGQITKRVFPPLNTTDYASYIRQLPRPNQVDGYFWVVGGTGTGSSLKAFEQAYGPVKADQFIGNLFFAFLGNFKEVAPRLVGAYVGGFGTGPGLKTPGAKSYESIMKKWYPGLNGGNYADGFVYNYYNAAWATVRGLQAAKGNVAKLAASMPRTNRSGYEITDKGTVKLDANRQAIQDQYPLQIVKGADGNPSLTVAGFVPNVSQAFGGLFKKSSPPPGRNQPSCKRVKTPWQGKIKAVRNGVVTNQVIK
ncbi:MAG: ABC transporter substrate-binding protein [Actinobacteria bacterium]|nr:ABC transporter substrate-binding protein [Actinomycetota bacterium]